MSYSHRKETEADETIYNLIPKDAPAIIKPKRYKSIHAQRVNKTYYTNKIQSKTMGPAKVPQSDIKNFLKKGTGPKVSPGKTEIEKGTKIEERKPPVPRYDEQPVLGTKSSKDFIRDNALTNINSVARKPDPKFVDSPMGATHALIPSGLVPKYAIKKDFGKVPIYLEKRKENWEQAQKEYDNFVLEQQKSGALKQLNELDRQAVIEGLKKNWEDLYKQYQGLSVITDTMPKKARKERLEAEMKRLEKDIDVMEKHKVIYISSDDFE